MAAVEARCPHCQARFLVPAEQAGTTVRCGKCRETFTATTPASPVVARPVLAARPVRAGGRSGRDDVRDRRTNRRSNGGNGTVLLVLGIVAAVGLLGVTAVGLAAYYFLHASADVASSADLTLDRESNPPNAHEPDPPKAREPGPPKARQPVPPTADGRPADSVVLRVQASTVGVWTDDRKRIRGGGFFAGPPGYVVTSARVIGHGPGQAAKPTAVEVLVGGGSKQRTLTARVFGADPDADLALLKLDAPDLPPPLPFGRTTDVRAKQMVGAYGIQPVELRRGASTTLYPVGKIGPGGPDGTTVEVLREGDGFWGGPVADAAGEVLGMHPSGPFPEPWVTLIPAERVSRFVADQVASGGRFRRPGSAQETVRFPAVTPLPIRPAPLTTDRTEVKLPSPAAAACAGGGGRFFILHLPASRQLAIFDVNQARVVKSLPAPADAIHFAAGMTKLLVVAPQAGTITRYDLTTLEQEATAPLPFAADVKLACMGAASAGPLFLYTGRPSGTGRPGFRLVDPATFREVSFAGPAGITWWSGREEAHVRASPDGRVYGAWTTRVAPGGLNVLTFRDGEATTANEHTDVGAVVPAVDGTLVTGAGLFTPELKSVPEGKDGKEFEDKYRLRVPAQTGPFYLTSPGGGEAQVNRGVEAGKPTVVYAIGDVRPIATLPDVELPNTNTHYKEGDFTQDRRVHFVPEAKLIAVVPATKDRLVLYRFDLDAHLKRSGIDYLYVTSRPPADAERGRRFAYTPTVLSRTGGVKLTLEAGPGGMTVSGDTVTWQVPRDFAANEVFVVLSASGAGGRKVPHTFKLTVTGEVAPADGKSGK